MSTPNLAIPHVLQSQAQKEVTANAAFDALDQAIAGLLEVDVSASGTITVDSTAAIVAKPLHPNPNGLVLAQREALFLELAQGLLALRDLAHAERPKWALTSGRPRSMAQVNGSSRYSRTS